MPRDLAGNYTLPAGNPVVNNTLIESAWANSTLTDLTLAINQVPTRDGKLNFTGPISFAPAVYTQDNTALRFTNVANSGFWASGTYGIKIAYNGQEVLATTAYGITVPSITSDKLYLGLGPSTITTLINSTTDTATVTAVQVDTYDFTMGVLSYSFTMGAVRVYDIVYNAGIPKTTFYGTVVVGSGAHSATINDFTFKTNLGYSFSNNNVGVDTTWLTVSGANSSVNFPAILNYKGLEVGWRKAEPGTTTGAGVPTLDDVGKTLYINSNLTINGIFSVNDQFRVLNAGNTTVTLTGASGLTQLIDGATNTTSGTYSLPPKRLVTLIFLTVNAVVIN